MTQEEDHVNRVCPARPQNILVIAKHVPLYTTAIIGYLFPAETDPPSTAKESPSSAELPDPSTLLQRVRREASGA